MKVVHQKVKLPSKTQFLAKVGDFVPSNLYKSSFGGDTVSMMSTATKTFNRPNIQQTQSILVRKNTNNVNNERTLNAKQPSKSGKTGTGTGTTKTNQKKNDKSRKFKTGHKRQRRSLVSSSSSSARSNSVQRERITEQDGAETQQEQHQRESRSLSNPKMNLPGNYEYPSYLYKGIFQNDFQTADVIQLKDQEVNEMPVRKGYKEYEEEYNLEKEKKAPETLSPNRYLEQKLALYKLLDNEEDLQNMGYLQKNKKLISISDNINNCQDWVNPNYMPNDVPLEKMPGQLPGKRTVSERERAAMFIQKIMRGILTRQRVAKMKENLKKHLNGDLDADPYAVEFCDLNVPAFKKMLAFEEKINETKKPELAEYDPDRKLLTNTFYSLIRSTNFFPEDPMDYYLLAETKDEDNALFPKLIYEDQKAKSKEVLLHKKYNYLMEKPLIKEVKTDESSVIKNFLKSNLASISESDLKVDKFKIEYKSPVRPKPKPSLAFGSKSPKETNIGKNKRFNTSNSGIKDIDEIHTDSEVYTEDFEPASGIKESIIQESIDTKIKESLPLSESRLREDIVQESIQESIEQSSPIGKIGKKFSNKSISEEIEAASSKRFGRNSSIEEEIPLSESIQKSKSKMKKMQSNDDIDEEIEVQDSYTNEEFESLDESIQESIEKFQSFKNNSKTSARKSDASPPSSNKKKIETQPVPSKPTFNISKPVFTTSKLKEEKAPAINPQSSSQSKPKVPEAQKPKTEFVPIVEQKYHLESDDGDRRSVIRPDIMDMPPSRNADILFANFQKELEKMIYVDSLAQKVTSIEKTIETLYDQKEYNLLHSLQSKAEGAKMPNDIVVPPGVESNSLVYLMQKQNNMERSISTISRQLNFLINNLTGANPIQPAQMGAKIIPRGKSERKPRPIIPVRKAQNVRINDEASQKSSKQSEVQKPEVPKVKDVLKPKEELSKDDKSNHKFVFKLSSEAQSKKADEENEKDDKENKLSLNLPKNGAKDLRIKESPKPVVPEVKDEALSKISSLKSAKFGKWQESSSENQEEEIVEEVSSQSKRDKSLGEEVDYSVKEFSDSSDRGPAQKKITQKLHETKVDDKQQALTLPGKIDTNKTLPSLNTNTNKVTQQAKVETKKAESPKEESFEEIIEEVVDLPSERNSNKLLNKDLKQNITPAAKAEDSDSYYEEEFENLSEYSEPKEEKAPVVNKQSVVNKPKEDEKSILSSDIEAALDLSDISWQAPLLVSPQPAAKKPDNKEKKVDEVTNLIMDSILKEITKDLFPKRNFAQIEDVKAKLKHAHIADTQSFNVHQETINNPHASNDKMSQSQLTEEDIKHSKYADNVKKELATLTEKMGKAQKQQIIGILINHINFADPRTRLTIFDKSPIKDESIVDAYNEILLKLFQSEFRKLNTEFATTKEVEQKMLIKLDGLITRSRDILLKKIGQTHTETEEYKNLGRNFNVIYDTFRNKRMPNEENEFFEEEDDIKRLIEEENNKLKETLADQVMETLFEEAVQELRDLAKKRKRF